MMMITALRFFKAALLAAVTANTCELNVCNAAPSLSAPVRQANGSIAFTVSGAAGEQVTVQGSRDSRNWTDLQSLTLSETPLKFEQSPNGVPHQFFRTRSATVTPVPPGGTLPPLADSVNSVFVAGEGFDTVQFAPNGNLGMIFWNGRDLVIRERYPSGGWIEQTVSSGGNLFQMNSTRTDYKFQPAALLLYDSSSQPHVFRVSGGKEIAHHVRSGSNWTQLETLENSAANSNIGMLVGAVGAGNIFHLAAVSSGTSPNLSYGSNRTGSWSWNNVSSIGAFPTHYLAPSYAPRWLSLAVDSKNAAHLVFRPEYRISFVGGYVRAYNELAYASNKSGQWAVKIVQTPRDDSGEAGHGTSIAIGPDDKPYIASWHNERGPGGSAENSRLFFQSQDDNGNWSRIEVISRPDGYIAGDGEKGTGFAPYLRFDSRGRPHILFLDHASEHFGESGQSEYAGHIRHAWREGGQWQIESVSRQTTPMREQTIYPAFAMNGTELVVTGLQRETQWNMSGYPPTVNSNYRYVVVTAPLR